MRRPNAGRARAADGVGRPLASEAFLDRMAALPGRAPRNEKATRKPKTETPY